MYVAKFLMYVHPPSTIDSCLPTSLDPRSVNSYVYSLSSFRTSEAWPMTHSRGHISHQSRNKTAYEILNLWDSRYRCNLEFQIRFHGNLNGISKVIQNFSCQGKIPESQEGIRDSEPWWIPWGGLTRNHSIIWLAI